MINKMCFTSDFNYTLENLVYVILLITATVIYDAVMKIGKLNTSEDEFEYKWVVKNYGPVCGRAFM